MFVLPTTIRCIELVVMVKLAIVASTFVLMFERRFACMCICMHDTIEMHILIRYDVHMEHTHVYTYDIIYGMYDACVYDKDTHTYILCMSIHVCVTMHAYTHTHTFMYV